MTHIPGHIGSDNTSALTGLDSDLSGGGGFAGAYTNQVYLGKTEVPAAKGVIRGKKIDTGKAYSDKTLTTQQAKALYLTDPNVEKQWLQTLRKNGIDTSAPGFQIKARTLWDLSVDGASDWYATSNGKQKITPDQYLGWYVGGQKKGPALPSRSIYQYAPEQLAAKIDETAQNLLGRAITDADKTASWYQDLNKALNKMVMQGTVTTTKQVKNPKTGKMENVTIQKPEVTAEALGQTITSALEEADTAALERKKNLDFANWAFKKMGG